MDKDKRIRELEEALSDIRGRYKNLKSYRKSEYDKRLMSRLWAKNKIIKELELKIKKMEETK